MQDSSSDRRYETWMLTEGIVPLATMKAIWPYVNGGGSIYRAHVVGFFDGGGPTAILEVVFDASKRPTAVLSWRDVSHLGIGTIPARRGTCHRGTEPITNHAPNPRPRMERPKARGRGLEARQPDRDRAGIPGPLAAGRGGSAEQEVGKQIVEALAARGIGQVDALVAVGRGSVELRQLQLPAAPEDELPKMVQLRAMLEFNELDEKWPLDFVPIDEPGGPSQRAGRRDRAGIRVERIRAVCQQSGLQMQRVLLRSCAAAALLAVRGSRRGARSNCWSSSFPTRPI